MIRPTTPADTDTLVDLARGTGVFKPIELVALREVLDDYHAANQAEQHQAITYEENGQVLGFAYYAPAAMTDRTWDLYWIAVTRQTQARGIGSALLREVEDAIRRAGGRLLLIDTSSLPHYDLTRRFYLRNGYDQTAMIKDFYADGDDKVVFRKHF
jgi:ribosomal protein S18 acetylase RimI-like enzyme